MCRAKIIKLLEENIYRNKWFVSYDTSTSKKEKIGHIKIKNFCAIKGTNKECEKATHETEMFTNYLTGDLCPEHIKFSNKNNPKHLSRHYSKLHI